jgi:ankyrin repeat protein
VSSASPGDNPLLKAAEKGLTEAIKCLLEAGADANVLDMVRMLIWAHLLVSCLVL